MVQRSYGLTTKKSAKFSMLVALVALLIAVPFSHYLLKNYGQKPAVSVTNQRITLPKIENDKKIVSSLPVSEWQTVKMQRGDSLSSIFKRLNLNKRILQAVMSNNKYAKALSNIKPSQELRVLVRNQILEKMTLSLNATQKLFVYREGNLYRSIINTRKTDEHDRYVTARIKGSLYTTAQRMNIPSKLIKQMTDILHWEIDFAKEIRAGDQFTIIYKALFVEDKQVDSGNIIAVSYTNRGKKYQAVRHLNADGDYDYFTPQGTSLKKAFTRYPVKFSHISSAFSLSRYHPMLHYSRAHKGVDLAAPIGTPIYAIGDGHIETIGRENGYGNMIKIKHDKTYSSIYGHMLRFQKGLAQGAHVKRGQVIGYVGQTGLASGPHCHFEVHVNQKPKNPTTVNLPRSSPVSGRELASFKANTAALLARLKLYEEAYFAASTSKSKKA